MHRLFIFEFIVKLEQELKQSTYFDWIAVVCNLQLYFITAAALSLSLPKRCNFTPRNVHERFQTLLTPVLTIFTDFLSAVVTSEIAQILSLYGGGFLALKWQS